MSTALKLEHEDDGNRIIAALREDGLALRRALKSALDDKEKAEKLTAAMTHALLASAERTLTQLAAMQEQLNAVALAASLVPDLKRRIEFLEGQTSV
jgi:hypothetical protein